MKEVLYVLSNLLYVMNRDRDSTLVPEISDRLLRVVTQTPGPRIDRLVKILELLATDAVE